MKELKLPTATPYIASYIIIKNNEGRIALLLRKNTAWMDGHYGLPAGKVEKNESFVAGAIREVREEIDLTVSEKDMQHVLTMHRKSPDSTWVDLFFMATTWQGEPRNAEPNVHSELAWFAVDNLPTNIVPNVKEALEQITKGVMYTEYGWEQ